VVLFGSDNPEREDQATLKAFRDILVAVDPAYANARIEVFRQNHLVGFTQRGALQLNQISAFPHAPNLIVAARTADARLWADVLNMGGYDLPLVPYESDEVIRIATLASLDWKRKNTVMIQKAGAW
jgi:hypothetical protein